MIERERPAGRVRQRDRAQGAVQRLAVVGLTAGLLERRLGDHAVDVESRRVDAWNVAVVAHHPVDESLVARRVQVRGVGRARDEADGLVAERLQERVVAGGPSSQDRQLEALVLVLLHELQRIGAGESLDHRIDTADLSQVRRVVRRHQGRPQLLHDPAARVLEDSLEAGHLLVAEREVVGDGDHPLELQLLRRVVGQRVHVLRRGRRGPYEVRVGPALGHVLGGGEAQDRHLRLGGVVGDGQELEGRERSEDHIDVLALHQLLGLGLRAGGIAAGVGDDELDLAAGHRVVPVLEEADGALLHLDPAGSERARLDREQADANRLGLRDRRERQGRRDCHARGTGQEPTPIDSDRHLAPPLQSRLNSSWEDRARAPRGS